MRAQATTPAAVKQRRYRQRKRECKVVVLSMAVDPMVIEALIQQGKYAGLTERQAEAASRDRKKLATMLADNEHAWARWFLGKESVTR